MGVSGLLPSVGGPPHSPGAREGRVGPTEGRTMVGFRRVLVHGPILVLNHGRTLRKKIWKESVICNDGGHRPGRGRGRGTQRRELKTEGALGQVAAGTLSEDGAGGTRGRSRTAPRGQR